MWPLWAFRMNESFILFLNVCGCRGRELSLSDLLHVSFTYEIPELRWIWANVRGLRSFLWKIPAAKYFIAFSWMEIFYNRNYSSLVCCWIVAFALVTGGAVAMAVACHGLCARQGWPLLASWFKCSSASQCLGAEELCLFLAPSKRPETGGSQARHSWELLWMLWCGCPGCWGHLPYGKSQLPTCVREFVAALFPANPSAKKIYWDCICFCPRIASVSRTWLSPREAFTQTFYLYCRLYLHGLLSGQTLVFLKYGWS